MVLPWWKTHGYRNMVKNGFTLVETHSYTTMVKPWFYHGSKTIVIQPCLNHGIAMVGKTTAIQSLLNHRFKTMVIQPLLNHG